MQDGSRMRGLRLHRWICDPRFACWDTYGERMYHSFAMMSAHSIKYYQVILNTLHAATGDIALTQSTFVHAFTEPENPTDKLLKTLLTVFSSLLGVLNACVGFTAGVAKAGLFDGKLIDKGSAAVGAAASAGATVAKDPLPA